MENGLVNKFAHRLAHARGEFGPKVVARAFGVVQQVFRDRDNHSQFLGGDGLVLPGCVAGLFQAGAGALPVSQRQRVHHGHVARVAGHVRQARGKQHGRAVVHRRLKYRLVNLRFLHCSTEVRGGNFGIVSH